MRTPTGATFTGVRFAEEVVGVSVMRSGESMEAALRQVARDVKIGKILIQRDETDPQKRPKLFYSKLPAGITGERVRVFVLEPMVATGHSALAAVRVIVESGVRPESITVVNVVSCAEGLAVLLDAYPTVQVCTAAIDDGLTTHKFLSPGLGDFGDRYFGTL